MSRRPRRLLGATGCGRRRTKRCSATGGRRKRGRGIWSNIASFFKRVVPYAIRGTSFGTPGSYLVPG